MIEINYGIKINDTLEGVNRMTELKDMKVVALKEMAKEMNIRGWRTMKKDELVEAIENNQQSTETETVVDEAPVVPEEIVDEADVSTQVEDEVVPEVAPVTPDESASRKNKKRMLEYNGKTQTLTAWAKELGIRHQTLYNRIVMKGMDIAEAFEMPIKKA